MHAIASAIAAEYLYRDRVPAILAALDDQRRAGPATETGREFADRVTAALQRASPDGHLYLRDDSARYQASRAPTRSEQGLTAYDRAESRRQHHGLASMSVLPNGIRYLRISAFRWAGAETQRAYDAAIAFLRAGEALIVDVRGNGGGSSEGPDHLLNTMLPPRTLLYRYEGVEATAVSRTGDDHQSGVLRGKLLYVLVDGHTGSAAEAFTYALQQAKVARVVGDPTYGAANNNREIPIGPRFMLSLSYRRPVSPISGTNWEGRGVQPDLAVPGVRALAAAESDALDRLGNAAQIPAATRQALAWAHVDAAARANPPVMDPAVLQRLAGQYGASRVEFSGRAPR